MRNATYRLALCTIFVIAAASAALADPAQTPPDLKGVWKGEAEVYYPTETKKLTTELRVTEQDGWYFKGDRHWKLLDVTGKPIGYVMDKAVNEADEPFLGVIGFDGKTLSLVESGDWGRMKAVITDSGAMELIYTESGEHPLVFRTVLTKQ